MYKDRYSYRWNVFEKSTFLRNFLNIDRQLIFFGFIIIWGHFIWLNPFDVYLNLTYKTTDNQKALRRSGWVVQTIPHRSILRKGLWYFPVGGGGEGGNWNKLCSKCAGFPPWQKIPLPHPMEFCTGNLINLMSKSRPAGEGGGGRWKMCW